MVPVRDYKSVWEYIVSQIPAIDKLVMVDNEDELNVIIKDDIEDGQVILVAVFPSSDLNAIDEDDYSDIDSCVIYVLQKIEERNSSVNDIMNEREKTQGIMTIVRQVMISEAENHHDTVTHRVMRQVLRGKQHIDRERNFLDCNGYSLSFSIKTDGI